MRIKFQFDAAEIGFTVTPETELEKVLLSEMAKRSENGSRVTIRSIATVGEGFVAEIKVNGGR